MAVCVEIITADLLPGLSQSLKSTAITGRTVCFAENELQSYRLMVRYLGAYFGGGILSPIGRRVNYAAVAVCSPRELSPDLNSSLSHN